MKLLEILKVEAKSEKKNAHMIGTLMVPFDLGKYLQPHVANLSRKDNDSIGKYVLNITLIYETRISCIFASSLIHCLHMYLSPNTSKLLD